MPEEGRKAINDWVKAYKKGLRSSKRSWMKTLKK
jgi:hypothetical protein